MSDYEFSAPMREAREALIEFRKRVRRLTFIAGGRGYDNMGQRELSLARERADEALMWMNAASASLRAGAIRAEKLGYHFDADQEREA